jgi:hypothetical protein
MSLSLSMASTRMLPKDAVVEDSEDDGEIFYDDEYSAETTQEALDVDDGVSQFLHRRSTVSSNWYDRHLTLQTPSTLRKPWYKTSPTTNYKMSQVMKPSTLQHKGMAMSP